MGLLTEMLHESLLNEAVNFKLIRTDIPTEWAESSKWQKVVDATNDKILEVNNFQKLNQIISLSRDVLSVLNNNANVYTNSDIILNLQTLSRKQLDVNIHPNIDKVIKLNNLVNILAKNKQFCKYVKDHKMSFDFFISNSPRFTYIALISDPIKDAKKLVDEFNALNISTPNDYKLEVKVDEDMVYVMWYLK